MCRQSNWGVEIWRQSIEDQEKVGKNRFLQCQVNVTTLECFNGQYKAIQKSGRVSFPA